MVEEKKMTFESALQELEAIVERLEKGEVSLDDAVVAYERGTELKKHCQERLDEARMKVEKIRETKGENDSNEGSRAPMNF